MTRWPPANRQGARPDRRPWLPSVKSRQWTENPTIAVAIDYPRMMATGRAMQHQKRTRHQRSGDFRSGHQGLQDLVYFSGIFTPERYGDMWRFSVYPVLSNPLKYSSPNILYYNGEFLI
jgi:hypothetical protein